MICVGTAQLSSSRKRLKVEKNDLASRSLQGLAVVFDCLNRVHQRIMFRGLKLDVYLGDSAIVLNNLLEQIIIEHWKNLII